ncbi:MAG: Asp-tRNA(Asn)/Glu-tRNA(Gln) amidotransferase subunit GatA [Bdellovibrionales bacterium]|nr:Asp-tRNA(Asn)/Glu-tRNA(Gln) amidotransferase subunit GatA [Bdellovibrionales bacterium]
MSEVLDLTVAQLVQKLITREISAVEITESYLAQIESQMHLGCYLSVWHENALKAAKEADSAGAPSPEFPLRGIPLAIKDIFTTSYGTTTCGSQFLHEYESPFTATCVQRLLDAGGIVLGKTNLDEFAMGSSNENSSFFPVKNPWDVSRVPGGSSGGSAAAVAARTCPVALGTDTGGSIRQPAAFCGITGFKPTYGRVSRYGLVAFASSLDQAGPLGLTAEDCALVGRVISGVDPKDSTSVAREVTRWEQPLPESCKGLRIGIPKEYFLSGIDPEISLAVESAARVLEVLGAERVEISLPHTEYAIATYYVIAPAEASSNLARFDGVRYAKRAAGVESLEELYLRSRSEGFGSEVKRRILMGTYVLSSGYYDAYYLRAQKVRRLIQQDFLSAFENSCDLILCPTTPTVAFRHGENSASPLQMYLNDVFTIPTSLAGLPAVSLPCGMHSEGLPIGFQLIGRPWDEHRLLSVGQEFQQETTWHSGVPIGILSSSSSGESSKARVDA